MASVPFFAMIFESVGAGEWVVLFAVVLIVVGPKRLPEVARKLGRMTEMFRRAADEFRRQLLTMDQEPVTPPPDPSATDVDGVPQGTDGDTSSVDDPYHLPDTADYPGNEDQVEAWSSTQLSDIPPDPAPQSDAAAEPVVDSAVADAAVAESFRPQEESAPAAEPQKEGASA